MATKVDIWNRALAHVGLDPVQSVLETSAEALACASYYDETLEELIDDFPTAFTVKTVGLALHAVDPPADWTYRYQLPSDCVRALEVIVTGVTRAASDPIPFSVESLPDGSERTVLTDTASAELRYAFLQPDTTQQNPKFTAALVRGMAVKLAKAFVKDEALYRRTVAEFGVAVGEARARAANEGQASARKEPRAIAGRRMG